VTTSSAAAAPRSVPATAPAPAPAAQPAPTKPAETTILPLAEITKMNAPEPKPEKKESVSTVIDSPIASKSVPPPPEPAQEAAAAPQQSTATASPPATSSLWQQAVSERKPSMVSIIHRTFLIKHTKLTKISPLGHRFYICRQLCYEFTTQGYQRTFKYAEFYT